MGASAWDYAERLDHLVGRDVLAVQHVAPELLRVREKKGKDGDDDENAGQTRTLQRHRAAALHVLRLRERHPAPGGQLRLVGAVSDEEVGSGLEKCGETGSEDLEERETDRDVLVGSLDGLQHRVQTREQVPHLCQLLETMVNSRPHTHSPLKRLKNATGDAKASVSCGFCRNSITGWNTAAICRSRSCGLATFIASDTASQRLHAPTEGHAEVVARDGVGSGRRQLEDRREQLRELCDERGAQRLQHELQVARGGVTQLALLVGIAAASQRRRRPTRTWSRRSAAWR